MISWKAICKDETFVELFTLYLETHPAGGSLHIVLDDGNNSDKDIEFCIRWAMERGDIAGEFIGKRLLDVAYEDREKYQWYIIGEDE